MSKPAALVQGTLDLLLLKVLDLQPPLGEWLQEEEVEQAIIVERLQAMADARMAAKTEGVEPERWIQVEKNLLIQTLDHHWKEHLATLDALRAVIHLRSYAQKKPIDEYKQEAFLLFERLLIAIREDVTRMLMRAQVQFEEPAAMPMMAAGDFALPDFITNHIDPLSGDDDSADLDASGNLLSRMPSWTIYNTYITLTWRLCDVFPDNLKRHTKRSLGGSKLVIDRLSTCFCKSTIYRFFLYYRTYYPY